ncbi:MAG: hypothetical protein LBO64_05255 [Desulfovibrio sp.]|jgi:threonine synthase|nr:hypothetical protein [Desulfovibrio sp.]
MPGTNSYISHLPCSECKKKYAYADMVYLCACGSPLLVQYDLARVARELDIASPCLEVEAEL